VFRLKTPILFEFPKHIFPKFIGISEAIVSEKQNIKDVILYLFELLKRFLYSI
jgi:hypothetical protein